GEVYYTNLDDAQGHEQKNDNQIEMQTLLCGKSVTKRIYKQIAFDQIKENKDLFYSLLVFAGYLNPALIEPDIYKLTIPPNQEVRKIYEDRVIQ
ncbi:9385_t:CDS:1, partial [Funneliformis geosporum]